jgi:hypothetical protein
MSDSRARRTGQDKGHPHEDRPGGVEREEQAAPSSAPATASQVREHISGQEPTIAVDGPLSLEEWQGWLGRVVEERYRIIEFLGEGGMGAVFAAEHLKLQKQVAFKVVRQQFAGNGEIAARFAREAMATGMFEHPNVASAIDFGTLPEGGAYFVMQLVRGQSLSALLREHGRLPWRRAVAIGAQLADALSAALAIEVVHRDLKPDNIVIQRREDGSDLAKILDFGIARHTRDSLMPPPSSGETTPRNLTREGAVVGTPGYMSPEQAMGDRVSHAADLYALGAVVWECVAGRQLWTADDLSTLIKRQLTEPVPSLREQLPGEGIPEELDRLLARLLAVSTRERPQSAGEVRDALQLLLLAPATPVAPVPSGVPAEAVAVGAPPVERRAKAGTAAAGKPETREPEPRPEEAKWPEAGKAPERKPPRPRPVKRDETDRAPEKPVFSGVAITVLLPLIFAAFFAGALLFFERDPRAEVQELSTALEQAADIKPPIRIERSGESGQSPEERPGIAAEEGGEREAEQPREAAGSGGDPEAVSGSPPMAGLAAEPPAAETGIDSPTAEGAQTTPLLLTVYVKPLMEGKTAKARLAAAKKVLAHSPRGEVPAYLLAVANLYEARTCKAKKKQVLRLEELGDARALPALLGLSRQRRSECRPRTRRDCLACLRRDLARTIERLETGGP